MLTDYAGQITFLINLRDKKNCSGLLQYNTEIREP